MTRRYIVFFDERTGRCYSTPEFNGDKSKITAFHSQDLCDKDWPDIVMEFKGVKSLKDFKAASEKAQGYYHSFLGDYILPVTRTGFTHEGAREIGYNLWQVEARL
jgi:hypothetical protein